MRFPNPVAVKEIALRFGGRLVGDQEQYAHGINEIHKVQPGDITFVDVEKYYNKCLSSAATIILINKEAPCPPGKTLIILDNPFNAYDALVKEHRPFRPLAQWISDTAEIHPSAIIEPGVIIGHHVSIGADTYIQSHCYIGDYSNIGSHVKIQAGTIIGTDAFYFKQQEGRYRQWCSGGDVIIEDHVNIGAGCTINKGVSGSTIIGEGSIIDCQVHIGHGVVVGKNCLLAGQVGIGGKTVIGDRVKIYGQAGISNNLFIGDDSIILGQSGVTRNLKGGLTYFGLPAEEAKKQYAQLIALKRLTQQEESNASGEDSD